MKEKYFSDTDTAHIEFTDKIIHETKTICENISIDIDEKGQIVSMNMLRRMQDFGNSLIERCPTKPH